MPERKGSVWGRGRGSRFRRPGGEDRFRRRRSAGRLRNLLLLLVVVALVVAGVWAVYFSSLLTARKVVVTDAGSVLPEAQVRSAAAVPLGEPLARIDLDAVRTRVQRLVPVRSAEVSRQWPNAVDVRVVERTAVAVVERGGQHQGIDQSGVVFRTFTKVPRDLPTLRPSPKAGRDALREGARVVASFPPSLAGKVDHVAVRTMDQIVLEMKDGRQVQWGSSAESDLKARVLAVLLKQADAQRIDVSVPGRPTTAQ